jgi:hypothetical protein
VVTTDVPTQTESGTNAGSVTTVTNVTRVDVTTNIGGSQMAPAAGASGSILVNSDLLDTSKATSLTEESVMGIDTGSTKDISKTDTIQTGGNSKTVTTSSNAESVNTVSNTASTNNINAGLPEIHVNPDITVISGSYDPHFINIVDNFNHITTNDLRIICCCN